MLFSSITFLFYFLPAVMIIYVAAPKYMKNLVLVIASLFFYAWGEPRFVILMVVFILLGYIAGILIAGCNDIRLKHFLTVLFCGAAFCVLAYFKYADFFVTNVNNIFGMEFKLLNVVLPIGISFYTFQLISYIADVARGDVLPQKNIIKLAAYISMFPQLIAGPIVRYKDIATAIDDRQISIVGFSYGIRRFVVGLSKKVVLANTLGEFVSKYNSFDDKSVLFAWAYALSVTLQIYFDFAGYSDMAIGLGSMLGFTFPENFRYPLAARSVTDFWRRWHITLGAWFRDYLYIPLGGNRVGYLRWIFNIFIVWTATGLWHGASWNFVAWGLYFALFLVIEKKSQGRYPEKLKLLKHIYLILVVIISFVIFDNDLREAFVNLCIMFGLKGLPLFNAGSMFVIRDYMGVIIVSAVLALGLPCVAISTIRQNERLRSAISLLEPVFLAALLIVSVSFLINGSYNPFLYFRF